MEKMSSIPFVQIPEVPLSVSRPSSAHGPRPKTPKSMLKNLFSWKRMPAADGSEVVSPVNLPVEIDAGTGTCVDSCNLVQQKPPLDHRSRSDTVILARPKSRSKSRRRSRSRCRAIWDPPPLFQAYSQASMHDTLHVPTKGFLDWLPRNATNRASTRNPDNTDDEKDEIQSPSGSHKRSTSDSSTSSLTKKIFFLFENGHILQYKDDGSNDRLPERVLELSRESVAFASDAVLGQHWVLEVCTNGTVEDESKAAASRSPWSRMSLKAPDARRLSEKLLLVFESADSLFNWLIAIRKQIEGFGGLEYQPDAPPVPQLDLKRPSLRHTSSEYFKRKNGALFSRSSSALPLKLDDHTAHEKELPQLPLNLSFQRSISTRSDAASSVATTVSLDHLRESYSGSSTTDTTTSSDISSSSLSPTKDNFSPILKTGSSREVKSRTGVDKVVSRTPLSPLQNSQNRSSPTFGTSIPDPKRDSGVTDDTLLRQDAETEIEEIHSPAQSQQSPMDADVATSAVDTEKPLPVAGNVVELRQRLRQARLNLSTGGNEVSQPYPDLDERSSLIQSHAKKPSLGSTSKANYGLFPKRASVDMKAEPVVVLEQNTVSHLRFDQRGDRLNVLDSSVTPAVIPGFERKPHARSKSASKRPRPIALPQHLIPTEIDSPMRTPAVSDAMLDTNFGTNPSGAATEPSTPIEVRVPSLSGMNFDVSLFETVRNVDVKSESPSTSPKIKNLTPRRSMPNFHYGTAAAVSAPLGPPPSGPLPAVPQAVDGRTSRNTTPSKRSSTQGPAAPRRASTKSSSSTKKIRSPVPSYCAVKSRGRLSMSPEAKSVATFDSLETSPLRISLPLTKAKEPAPTIGQVSVLPLPPPMPDTPRHKKSPSTSSAKSHRSKKSHSRTPSMKSIHNTTNKLSLIGHLSTPPCGFDSDADIDNKNCFGIGAARSIPS